jgi:hypothetical protein
LRSTWDTRTKDQARFDPKSRHFGARFVSPSNRACGGSTESEPADVRTFMSGLLSRAQPIPSATFAIEVLADSRKGGRVEQAPRARFALKQQSSRDLADQLRLFR